MRGIEDRWSARDRQLRPTIPNASAADCVIRRRRRSHLLAAPVENPPRHHCGALLIRSALIIPPIVFEYSTSAVLLPRNN